MNKFFSFFTSLAICLASYSSIFSEEFGEPYFEDYSFSQDGLFFVDYIGGKGIGYDSSYGTLGFFYSPSYESSFRPFLDIRAHRFGHRHSAGNVGLGSRYFAESFTIGANLYYDFRNKNHTYHQLGAGLEFLSPCFDVRINGYFPLGNTTNTTHCRFFDDFIGDYFETCITREYAYTGVDAEVGKNIFSSSWACNTFNLYAALGGYYFNADKACSDCGGGSARLQLAFADYFALEVRASYDSLFHERVQGVFSVSIPFGSCKSTCDCCPIINPLPFRREIIVLDKHCHCRSNFY